MNRQNLQDVLGTKGLSATASRNAVDSFFKAIFDAIVRGDEVGIKNFVKFRTRTKRASVFMNNRVNKRMDVPEHRVVQTRFARGFKERFPASGSSGGET